MVNKKFCLGILLMVLVFGMTIVGCKDDDVQIIAFEYAEGTSNVGVFFSYSGSDVIINVKWNGVRNALKYDVYGQIEPIDVPEIKLVPDIKHFSTIQATGIGYYEFEGARIDISEVISGVKWRFGVTVTDIDKNHVPSKIVWSDYINIPLT